MLIWMISGSAALESGTRYWLLSTAYALGCHYFSGLV